MASCNQYGCECCTCPLCNRYYDSCLCHLKLESKDLLRTGKNTAASDWAQLSDYIEYVSQLENKLQEWIDNV